MQMAFCQNCGTNLGDKANSCPNCGTKANNTNTQNSGQIDIAVAIAALAGTAMGLSLLNCMFRQRRTKKISFDKLLSRLGLPADRKKTGK